ncbi:DUF3397 domain-containing protein [Salipaludibacillus keqinensis]|nr:DUF3397 domain-containing protein [Salipaludibacillus keqinensis]
MLEFAAMFVATFVTVPLLGLYLVYIVTVKITKKKQYSLKKAVDSSAILFIISVYFLVLEIWNFEMGWYIALFFLMSAVIFTIYHWKRYEDIQMKRVLKGVWRFQFVIFFFSYGLLVVYGLVFRIFLS